jgi:hypothetical protein
MARRPGGPEQVRKLEGSEEARRRLELVLETIAGRRTVEEACAALGVSAARFDALRREALGAALERLEPRSPGRPPKPAGEPSELDRLQAEIADLRWDLEAARVRELIAIGMPHLLKPRGVKKTARSGRRPGTRTGSQGPGRSGR